MPARAKTALTKTRTWRGLRSQRHAHSLAYFSCVPCTPTHPCPIPAPTKPESPPRNNHARAQTEPSPKKGGEERARQALVVGGPLGGAWDNPLTRARTALKMFMIHMSPRAQPTQACAQHNTAITPSPFYQSSASRPWPLPVGPAPRLLLILPK